MAICQFEWLFSKWALWLLLVSRPYRRYCRLNINRPGCNYSPKYCIFGLLRAQDGCCWFCSVSAFFHAEEDMDQSKINSLWNFLTILYKTSQSIHSLITTHPAQINSLHQVSTICIVKRSMVHMGSHNVSPLFSLVWPQNWQLVD